MQKLKHAKIIAFKVTDLCKTAIDVATKYDKIDLLTNVQFKRLCKSLLEKHVPEADAFSISRLSNSLRVLETFVMSKSPFDLKSGK